MERLILMDAGDLQTQSKTFVFIQVSGIAVHYALNLSEDRRGGLPSS
jgi:hypothetical protein